jgi:integrase
MAPKVYRQLRTMLNTAVEDGILGENPCRVRGAAKEHTTERLIPTLAQVQAVADAVEPQFRAAVLLASYCGLRKGECFGLARRHVILDGPYPQIVVERQRSEVAGKGLVFGDLKTDAAYRTVAIPASVLVELTVHLDRYVAEDAQGDPISARPRVTQRGHDLPARRLWPRPPARRRDRPADLGRGSQQREGLSRRSSGLLMRPASRLAGPFAVQLPCN